MLQGRNGENIIVVEVNTTELLATIEKNKIAHVDAYQKARVAFKKHVIAKAKQLLDEANAIDLDKKSLPNIAFHLNPPLEYTKEYERAIGMLRLHKGDTITIDSGSYSKFVDDEWEWKRGFESNNASYAMSG